MERAVLLSQPKKPKIKGRESNPQLSGLFIRWPWPCQELAIHPWQELVGWRSLDVLLRIRSWEDTRYCLLIWSPGFWEKGDFFSAPNILSGGFSLIQRQDYVIFQIRIIWAVSWKGDKWVIWTMQRRFRCQEMPSKTTCSKSNIKGLRSNNQTHAPC